MSEQTGMENGRCRVSRASRQGGFTLMEIMVVVVIIGILAALIVPNVVGRQEQAQRVKAQQDLRALESALDLYRMDNFRYPTTEQGLEALVEKPNYPPEPKNYNTGGYIKRLPTDPWGNEYVYLSPGRNGPYDLSSLGADGRPGGEGSDADINNWELE